VQDIAVRDEKRVRDDMKLAKSDELFVEMLKTE
jgi:hypothetical protein